jgi:hypothetical protein
MCLKYGVLWAVCAGYRGCAGRRRGDLRAGEDPWTGGGVPGLRDGDRPGARLSRADSGGCARRWPPGAGAGTGPPDALSCPRLREADLPRASPGCPGPLPAAHFAAERAGRRKDPPGAATWTGTGSSAGRISGFEAAAPSGAGILRSPAQQAHDVSQLFAGHDTSRREVYLRPSARTMPRRTPSRGTPGRPPRGHGGPGVHAGRLPSR